VTIVLDPVVTTPLTGYPLPGIEARHSWQPASGPAFPLGGVDLTSRSSWPNYRLQKIDGRHSRPDSDDKRDQRTGGIGEIVRRSLPRGKTEAWQGLIRGRTLLELRQGVGAFQAAFAENAEGTMTIFAPATYVGMPDFTFTARVITCTVPDEQTFGPDRRETSGWERAFTLGLRLSDPRYYETTLRTVTSSAFTSSQGLHAPFAVPFFIPGPGVAPGSLVASNGGTAPAEPILSLYGPWTDPGVVNDTVDAALIFKSGGLTVGKGQILSLDFRTRQIAIDGSPVSRDRIDWDLSNWWDAGVMGLAPGDNTIRMVGGGAGDPAKLVVSWHNPQYG
jgi:hypothetical protein